MARITLEDLKLCYALMRKAEDLDERIRRTRSLLTGSSRSTWGETRAGKGFADRISASLARIDEWEAEMRALMENYLTHVRVVDAAIDALPDLNQQRILRMRYIDALTWERISEKTDMSAKWCRELARRGADRLAMDD